MRPIMSLEEWALTWLAGVARAVDRGKVNQTQLNGVRRRVLSRGINADKVELAIKVTKAPPPLK